MNKIITHTLQLTLTSALTLLTHTAYSQGSGHALNFDGVNDYIETVNDFQASLPITISAWVRPENSSNFIPIYATDSWQDGTYHGVNLSFTPNGMAIAFGDGAGSGSWNRRTKEVNYSFSSTEWYHVVGVIRGANDMDLYINGINVGGSYTGTGGPLANTTDRPRIANYYSGTRWFEGEIDEVSVWNIALTQQNVRDQMCQKLNGNESGLVAYYRMDEGVDNSCSGGEDVCDLTGNGNHGTKF